MILPCLSRAEKDIQQGIEQSVLVESSMAKVEFSYPSIKPCSKDLQSEIRIIAEIAKAILPPVKGLDWEELASDYKKIRAMFPELIPDYIDYKEEE